MIARLVAWLLDFLVLVFIVRAVLRLVQGSRPMRRPTQPPQTTERSGGTLVRDPQCGTYVPQAGAVQLTSGNKTLYFCSTTCRDAYLART